MGNQALRTGLKVRKKFYLRQAIEQYSKGLELQVPDQPALNAALLTNRAHVQLLLGNMRNAHRDALAALKHDPDNVKVGEGVWGGVGFWGGGWGGEGGRRRRRE